MKRHLFLSLLSLISLSSLAQVTGFPSYITAPVSISGTPPVTISNSPTVDRISSSVSVQTRNAGLMNPNESRQIVSPLNVSSTGSAYLNMFSGATSGNNWQTAPNSNTLAANTLATITNFNIQPDPGRKQVIRQITVWANLPCNIYLQKQYSMGNTLYGKTGAISQGTVLQQMAETAVKADSQSVWKATFSFPADDPFVVRYGERVVGYYSRNGTQQPNFRTSIIGRDKTNSDRELAPYRGLFIGDSKTGITPDGAPALAQTQREFWHFGVCDSLSVYGYPTEPVNIAISGTDVSDWDWLIRNGRLDGIPFSFAVINLGTNDCTVGTWLSSGQTDGPFKTGMKSIISKIHILNPSAPIFVNNIGPTDLTSRQANIAAYRTEINDVGVWARAQGWPVYNIDNTNIFPTTDKSYFVQSEQSANGSTHESSKGLLAELGAIWPVVKSHRAELKPAR